MLECEHTFYSLKGVTMRKRVQLTIPQEEVFLFICQYKAENDGISPTDTEIAAALDRPYSTIKYLVLKLLSLGVVYRTTNGRGLLVTGGKWIPPPAPYSIMHYDPEEDNDS